MAFVVTRTLISPPIMGWFLYTLWFRSPGIPGAWSAFMGALVTLGMAGSQVWSYKLVRGWAKARRKAQHAATRKTE